MSTIPPGGIVKVAALLKDQNLWDIVNVYYFRNVTGDSIPHSEAADQLRNLMSSLYVVVNPAISDTARYNTLSIYNVTQDVPVGNFDWIGLTYGEAAGEAMPSQIAGMIYFRVLQKRTIGKKFLGPVSEGSSELGRPKPAFIDVLKSFGQALLSNTSSHIWEFVIRTRYDTYLEPVSFRVSPYWSTLSRRKERRGG